MVKDFVSHLYSKKERHF